MRPFIAKTPASPRGANPSGPGATRPPADRGIIRMCSRCRVPVCRSCQILLRQADGKSNVPMALAHDNWYGYVQEIIARLDVRWIECACASLCWTTQVIYQLEEPHGRDR